MGVRLDKNKSITPVKVKKKPDNIKPLVGKLFIFVLFRAIMSSFTNNK
jgi:hypothetical protein